VITVTLQPDGAAFVSSVSPAAMPNQRTQWAEHEVEEFLSIPFISEFVF
jgi:hypothetical protein